MVEEHIRLENEHDLDGVLRTFGETAQYDDEPWGEHYTGRDGVRLFYSQIDEGAARLGNRGTKPACSGERRSG